ncbi:hypothetical protein LPJ78_000287 [Coemansia sp. RSA 989]|nr:hypothetical protein BX667DRAFT_509593 [Coemansia mojavensis]KAJ1740252.1 hypothetical protein LPJ68_003957 [Coemansia sp. RSA 1086]KAJ1748877.1 hypothetical protein LPJ79_004162 [Coemansia sp. RSA 1821]KAJ1868349.1 hypothetical protein LPJ78_000287 [Coemansia sp. RSA 989]KAJ1875537.1 hypothetical protein LPJ55_000530 [Coemansia sp. RSA 990]
MKIDRILARLETGSGATKLLPTVESLVLTLSQRTRAPGARHFWRENLRRIQYANPTLPIVVNFPRKPCQPSLEIKFTNAESTSFSLSQLSSEDICKRLLEKAAPRSS